MKRMKKSKIVIDCDKERAEMLYKTLTKLHAWLSGWEAAGRPSPPGSEAVWQLRSLLKDAKES